MPQTGSATVEFGSALVESDGADLWVASFDVARVRASDGKVLEFWTGASNGFGVLVARGRVYVTGRTSPGRLYVIDPRTTPGAVTTLSSSLGDLPNGVATDGRFIWTANDSGSVSLVNPDNGVAATFPFGFNRPLGILFDGANIWVTDIGDNRLKKLDSFGDIIQSVTVGIGPSFPVFDGSNIWVPNQNISSITVVRARDGLVLASLTGNGLNFPIAAAFDGQRVLVTNSGGSVSMWNASDLTPIGSFPTGAGTNPYGACSDGINFWIVLNGTHQLARF